MKKQLLIFSLLALATLARATEFETKLYSTNFQNWDAIASSTTPTSKVVTTNATKETLTITLCETQVNPTGTDSKFSNTEVITAGYAMADKTATPYIETSVLADVTKVTYVHAATGGSRGWGLQCKCEGEDEWTTLHSAYCDQAGTAVEVEVNRQNVQLRWYNLNEQQNAYMTEFAIYGTVIRNFTDFEIDLTKDPVTLPEGVTEVSKGQFNDSEHPEHGWIDYTLSFKVDGPVLLTFGGCQYANKNATVTSKKTGEKLAEDIDIKSVGCYHNGGTATWLYNVEEEDELEVYLGQYSPYFKAEACAFVPDYVIAYYDQDGNKLGEETVDPSSTFNPLFKEEDLDIPENYAFRGWTTIDGKKIAEGAALDGDLKVYASVTKIEYATTGTHYKYDLTKNSFYMEDHELISATGKQHGSGHGFVFNNGEEMTLVVSPKAYVSVGLCTHTNTSEQIIRNAAGDQVAVMSVIKQGEENATPDGALCSFYYANANEEQDTLHFNFTTTSYIHSVEVYNVANPLSKTGHVYDIPAGDAAAFMLVCNQLEDGDTILLHDGVYDLGETVLTTISASHITIKGESMEGTIIKNAPDVATEGIATTATILNTGNDNVFEYLTLQNALDYYKKDDGRAVCLQDKGTRTACYHVRMLSYQDTYYSNKPGQQCWFEDCEIHGTVDFICGSGSVYFYNTLIYCEKRSQSGSGSDCITANNSQTAQQDKGYVFDRCTIVSECPVVSLSRTWNDQPQVAYLLTTLDMSKGDFDLNDNSNKIQRWTISGMNNCLPYDFSEYNTMDTDGKVISPESNKVNFFGTTEMETIIDYSTAESKSYTHFFREDWEPARNYVAFPEPTTTLVNSGVSSQQPAKVLRDGQLLIIHNGTAYTVLGQKL